MTMTTPGSLPPAAQCVPATVAEDGCAGECRRLRAALENVRLLAARHRQEPWAAHLLRFCAEAGVTGAPLRAQSVSPDKAQP